MFKLALSGFVVSAALLVGGADEALKKERALFKGTWKITKFETAKGEIDKGKEITLTFHADGSFEMSKGNETKKGTYKLNPAAKPKEIDFHADQAGDVGKGIYEFAKDKLRLCFIQIKDADRPTGFALKEGSEKVILTLERGK